MAGAEEKDKREAEEATRPVKYCPKCGAELRPNVSFCPKCGTLISEGTKAREAEEAQKAKEAEEKAKREAEEAQQAKEAEEKAKREAEEARQAKEAEEKAKKEAEEAAKAARPVTYCPKCGVELRPNVSFCPKCGTLVSESEKARETEEAQERAPIPISVERAAEPVKAWTPLLKRWWFWVGAAVLVVLIALFIFILVALGQGG